jgi:hypothetical protein
MAGNEANRGSENQCGNQPQQAVSALFFRHGTRPGRSVLEGKRTRAFFIFKTAKMPQGIPLGCLFKSRAVASNNPGKGESVKSGASPVRKAAGGMGERPGCCRQTAAWP